MFSAAVAASGLGGQAALAAEAGAAAATFHSTVQPLLSKYCYECHGEGMSKGQVVFDEFKSDAEILGQRDLWQKALKNVRAGLMPPPDKDVPRPDPTEIALLANWIKYGAFATDPANPDPGRVTVRRLNRIEYRNTIRDLMGIDFNSEAEFPPDDSGNGFDNNGDVLTLSPLLLEKYLSAAEAVTQRAVPKVARVLRERVATGRDFRGEDGRGNAEQMSAKQPAHVSYTFNVEESETYQLVFEFEARGTFDYDPGHCKVICRVDGQERFVEDVVWQANKAFRHEQEFSWQAGAHTVSFEVVPLPLLKPRPEVLPATGSGPTTPAVAAAGPSPVAPPEAVAAGRSGAPGRAATPPPPVTRLDVRVVAVQVRGPLNPKSWIAPENYGRFFPDGPAPVEPAARDRYAAEVLRRFTTRAFRRPLAEAKVRQLVAIARGTYARGGSTFEEGIGKAMMAVLASPRFIFRVEDTEAQGSSGRFAPVDEYSLATRLSYFLWSTMPDDELLELAGRGELRSRLHAQVTRMLADARAQAFVRNFTGQWLQARDVEFIPINARAVLGPNAPRNRDGRQEFDGPMRRLMRSETEMYFDRILRDNRSVLELIDSDYTFLNAQLARHYGVPDVTGDEMRLVRLPEGSPRGGVLTQGTVLAVTSNPTRTSPVKRGLFVLENILGTPTPPPPPDIPDLEEAKKQIQGREPQLSEMLAIHRQDKLCNSCHARMDPLGLAFENFNAMGGWRDTDAQQPIDATGQLITGEAFANVSELKRILTHERRADFYRCLTEKLLTYALGRGLDYYEVHTVDQIVDRLEHENGRMSALLMGVIESVPFQKQRAGQPSANPIVSSNPPTFPVARLEPSP